MRMYRCAVTIGVVAALVCTGATATPAVQDGPKIPDGVIHVKLPPGELHMERFLRNDKPVLRFTVGKTVVEGQTLYLGDDKGAIQFEATRQGMHMVGPKGQQGITY